MKYTVLSLIFALFVSYLIYEKSISDQFNIDYSKSYKFEFPVIKETPILGTPKFQNYNYYVVHLWATWCSTCKLEMPKLIDIIKKHPKTFFYMMSVSSGNKKVRQMIGPYGTLPANVVFMEDIKGKVKNALRTIKLPESHIFDTNKSYIKKVIGEEIITSKLTDIIKE